MHGFQFFPTQVVNQQGGPRPSLEITGELFNHSEKPVAILQTAADVSYKEPHFWIHKRRLCVTRGGGVLAPKEKCSVDVPIEFDRQVLAAIEDARAGKGGVKFGIRLDALIAPTGGPLSQDPRSVALGSGGWQYVEVTDADNMRDEFKVGRDQWIQTLSTFRFSTLDVFEVDHGPVAFSNLSEVASKHLREAELAYRLGDWSGTLAKASMCIEALLGEAGDGDIKAGAAELLARVFVDKHAPIAEPVNDLLKSTRTLANFGRHARPPFVPVERADAGLVLRLALSLWSYLGERLR